MGGENCFISIYFKSVVIITIFTLVFKQKKKLKNNKKGDKRSGSVRQEKALCFLKCFPQEA